MAKPSAANITGTAQARESAAFEELDLDLLDQVVGGNGGSRGGGNPPPPNVSFGLQVSGSIGPFSFGGTLTSSGFYSSGGAGKGWGGGFSADVVAIIPNAGHTAADVLTGFSVDGSAHGGLGVTGSVGSDGIVIGAGVGAGVSAGASYTVDMRGPIAETEASVQDEMNAFAADHASSPAGFVANEMHNIQNQADAEAVNQGLAAGRIDQSDKDNLGINGAAAIVRESDMVQGDSSALDDHGFHTASPDGSNPQDSGNADYGLHNASPDGSTPASAPASGDVAGGGGASSGGAAPSDDGSADHGFHNASPDGSTPDAGTGTGADASGGAIADNSHSGDSGAGNGGGGDQYAGGDGGGGGGGDDGGGGGGDDA